MSRPVLHGLVRMRVAAGLRHQGYGVVEARHLSESLPPEVIDAQVAATPEAMTAIGDGTHPIIDAFMAFINSPAGAALIAALIKLLLGGL